MDILTNLQNYFQQDLWQYEWWGNTVYDYLVALLLLIGFTLALKFVQMYLIHRLRALAERTKTDIDDTAVAILESLRPTFYIIVSFYISSQFLTLHSIIQQIIDVIIVVMLVYQSITGIQILIDFVVRKRMGDEEEESAKTMISLISLVVKVLLWTVGFLFVLSNLGVNVMSLLTGLGIGGIAVALAVQNILGDLLSSLAIFFDKPFQVGDFISIGDGTAKGKVEKIGIKTTRLRSLQGEELVIPNQELTSARIWNYRRMQERRITFTIGVTYETSQAKMKKIPGIIEKIITELKDVRFDRVHFTSFQDSYLGVDVVYYVETDDFVRYLDAQQEMNMQIKAEFEKAKIDMAYPTQTIHVQK